MKSVTEERFYRLLRVAMKRELGAMVRDDMDGNPDYIDTEQIRAIARRLYRSLQ